VFILEEVIIKLAKGKNVKKEVKKQKKGKK
jgi:hypothetical protein